MWKRKNGAPQKRIDSLIGGHRRQRRHLFQRRIAHDGQVRGNDRRQRRPCAGRQRTTQIDSEIGCRTSSSTTVNGPVADDHAAKAGSPRRRQVEMHVGAVIQGRLNHAEPGSASVVELKRVSAE
jgi:hypothetical protein